MCDTSRTPVIKLMNFQKQKESTDCGLFAIAATKGSIVSVGLALISNSTSGSKSLGYVHMYVSLVKNFRRLLRWRKLNARKFFNGEQLEYANVPISQTLLK